MAEPCGLPSSPRLRCFMASAVSAYFSDMASRAETHIQNIAPAPPRYIALDTPTMFPTPSVPARAKHSADALDTPPPLPFFRACEIALGESREVIRSLTAKSTPQMQSIIGTVMPDKMKFTYSSTHFPPFSTAIVFYFKNDTQQLLNKIAKKLGLATSIISGSSNRKTPLRNRNPNMNESTNRIVAINKCFFII